MKKTILIIFLIAWPAHYLQADEDKYITPEEFEWISNTSIDIMRAYDHCNQLINRYDPTFLFDADSVQTFDNDYIIPTNFGLVLVGLIQLDISIFWRAIQKPQFSLGVLAVGSSMDLQIQNDLPGYGANLHGWGKRYMILAVKTVLKEDIKFTLGGLFKQSPYIETGPDGSKYFSTFYDDEKEEYETEVTQKELFLHTDIYNYDLGVIFNTDVGVELTEFKKLFRIGERYGMLGPRISYYDFLDTVKFGLIYSDLMLTNFLLFKAEASMDVHKRGSESDLSYALSDMSIYLFKNSKGNSSERDFCISLTLGASYSKDFFNEKLFGSSWDVSFEDIRLFKNHYLMIGFGGSHNYHETLYRCPIKGETSVFIAIRWMV